MDILDAVAIDAGGADPLVPFADMARGADDVSVGPLERKLGLVVVVCLRPTPRGFAVATVARFAETPLMWITCLVTIIAASGGVA
jgi:hypothetical protein